MYCSIWCRIINFNSIFVSLLITADGCSVDKMLEGAGNQFFLGGGCDETDLWNSNRTDFFTISTILRGWEMKSNRNSYHNIQLNFSSIKIWFPSYVANFQQRRWPNILPRFLNKLVEIHYHCEHQINILKISVSSTLQLASQETIVPIDDNKTKINSF